MSVKGKLVVEKSSLPAVAMEILLIVMEILTFLFICAAQIVTDIYARIRGRPMKSLQGEIALVTGGGGGLGRLLALRLARLGAIVVLWDINSESVDETVKLVKAAGGKCKGYQVDLSRREEVYKAANKIRDDIGDVTLLINNAGVVSGRALLDTPDHLIERSFSVNAVCHFWTTKAFLPTMLEKNHGHIATIASLAGHVGIPKLVDYCASKFAAVGFDEALRMELQSLGKDGVHTTAICPYFIQSTGMFEDVSSKWVPTLNSEEVADRVVEAIRKNEKVAIVPGYLKLLLGIKWVVPWACESGFLRRIVPDAAPQHEINKGSPEPRKHTKITEDVTLLTNNNTINNNKVTPLIVNRSASIGERVL